ncbi:hypothetical protein S140_230 [Shewanella sp. phage 1/40]|uniref:hypothetical protein n=1 Tax=Shewanella sp. phage 1/40 TaxID=1458860 RepID=UPI0004F6BA10|nr:hypothetical protein S140_230 [Shewanella sp. phage 1/40]AHK11637.1 hypothetical protein S140_230 [Shewanella sp. phage 1/40]
MSIGTTHRKEALNMKFTNIATGEEVSNTNFTFNYKGFEISFSKWGLCTTPVLVFDGNGEALITSKPLNTIEQAINLINKIT